MPPAEPPFVDDDTISNDDVIYRRIPERQVTPDPNSKHGIRPSTGAFSDSSDGPLSVTLKSLCTVAPESLIAHMPKAGVAAVSVGLLRSLGQMIVRDPTPDDPAHVLIVGKKGKTFEKTVARTADWAVLPPPRDPE